MARVPEGFGVRRPDRSVDLAGARASGNAGAVPEAMDAMMAASLEEKGTAGGAFPATDSTRAERDAFRDEILAVVIPVMLGLVGGGAMGGAARGFGAARAGGAGIGRSVGAGAAESVGAGPFNLWGQYIGPQNSLRVGNPSTTVAGTRFLADPPPPPPSGMFHAGGVGSRQAGRGFQTRNAAGLAEMDALRAAQAEMAAARARAALHTGRGPGYQAPQRGRWLGDRPLPEVRDFGPPPRP